MDQVCRLVGGCEFVINTGDNLCEPALAHLHFPPCRLAATSAVHGGLCSRRLPLPWAGLGTAGGRSPDALLCLEQLPVRHLPRRLLALHQRLDPGLPDALHTHDRAPALVQRLRCAPGTAVTCGACVTPMTSGRQGTPGLTGLPAAAQATTTSSSTVPPALAHRHARPPCPRARLRSNG